MRIKGSLLVVLSGVSLVSMSSAAFAGGCGYGAPADQNCDTNVVVTTGNAPVFDPMTVRINQPMGHLRTVQFNRAPNVSITRVHGMGPTAGLKDAPTAFTDGCHPTSTYYCRDGGVVAPPAPAPQPYIAPALPAPVMAAPVMPAPVVARPVYQAPRTVYVGGGYDPTKFQPRQYGENTFTPGIAHVPTSYVDRSLSQDRSYGVGEFMQHKMTAPPAPGIAPLVMPTNTARGVAVQMHAPVMSPPVAYGRVTLPETHASIGGMGMSQSYSAAPVMAAPAPRMVGGMSAAPVNSGPVQTTTGLYASAVAPDGTYWEKTSGPTVFGSTIATQVICRRQLPTQTVNPVVGVPTPVCTPVQHAMHGPHLAGAPTGYAKKPAMNGGRYGAGNSRWTQ